MKPFVAGAAVALGARALFVRGLAAKLRHDVAALNDGDPAPLLAGYADDAVLEFNDGPHRWAGRHVGKPAIATFMSAFMGAGLRGEIGDVWVGGPPWALKLAVRFDDEAVTREGERLYANRTVLVAHTRWGRIVRQQDFYEDTGRILELERRLVALGR